MAGGMETEGSNPLDAVPPEEIERWLTDQGFLQTAADLRAQLRRDLDLGPDLGPDAGPEPQTFRGEVSPEPETVAECPKCGKVDYDKCGPPTGVFGADVTVHLYRHPDAQTAGDRFFSALINGQGLDEPLASQQKALAQTIIEVADFLLAKNRKYGGSVFTPSEDRVFSRHLSPGDLILARMDDKIQRIRAGAADDDEDPYDDLLGYLIILKAGKRMEAGSWNGS
jgi:hypothetical protein